MGQRTEDRGANERRGSFKPILEDTTSPRHPEDGHEKHKETPRNRVSRLQDSKHRRKLRFRSLCLFVFFAAIPRTFNCPPAKFASFARFRNMLSTPVLPDILSMRMFLSADAEM